MNAKALVTGIRRVMAAVLLAGSIPFVAAGTEQTQCPRIVSQSPYITHSLEWLGLENCIVGASRYENGDLPETGGVMDPDPQAIARLAPDLMLTSNWTDEAVWQDAAPPGARALRLRGFGSMAEIETNLRHIANAAASEGADKRAQLFVQRWRDLARKVDGRGDALVVSACGGVPYSFGRNTYIYDLFASSGFRMVETHPNIRHLKEGEPYQSLDALIAAFEPDWLFVLTRRDKARCAALRPRSGVSVVGLDGELFFHPAPTLLKGLEQLVEQRGRWQNAGDRH